MLCVGLIFRKNEVIGLQRIEKKDIPIFLLGGVLQPFLYFIFETYTYQSFASPTIAEAMLSSQPIMAPIMAWLLLREQVTRYNILGIIVSTIGMLLLLLVGSNNFEIGNVWGVLLAVITVSCSVGYSVVLRRIPPHYSPLTIVFYVQSISLVLFYILWGGDQLLNSQLSTLISHFSFLNSQLLPSLLSVLYLAVLASVTAFILFCYTVRYIGVTRANIFNNIRPVFTALLMLVIFNEQLPLWKWIGIIIIIIGLFISQKQRKL
jgi:drug/metabolite transporter (DMT)-like permease